MLKSFLTLTFLTFLASGCASKGDQFPDDNCQKVWLWTPAGENHTTLVVRMLDVPSSFWSALDLEIPPTAQYLAVSMYDYEYILGLRSPRAALLKSPAAIRLTLYSEPLESWANSEFIFPVAIEPASYKKLLSFLLDEVDRTTEGTPVLLAQQDTASYLADGILIRNITLLAARPYSVFNFCHSWAFDGLKSAGFSVPSLIFTSEDVRWEMDLRFPREWQKCTGYRNTFTMTPEVHRPSKIGLKSKE